MPMLCNERLNIDIEAILGIAFKWPFIKLLLFPLLIHLYLLTDNSVYLTDIHIGIHLLYLLTDIIVLWSSFILSEVILGAQFRLFVSKSHKDATIKLELFF